MADRFDVTIRFEADETAPDQIVQALSGAFDVPTATAARASGIRALDDGVEVTFFEVRNAPPPPGEHYRPPRSNDPIQEDGGGAIQHLADLPANTEVVVPIVRALVAMSAARQRAGLSPRQRVSITVEPSRPHQQDELRHS